MEGLTRVLALFLYALTKGFAGNGVTAVWSCKVGSTESVNVV